MQRCSRPLCSSQNSGGTTCGARPTREGEWFQRRGGPIEETNPFPQDPTACLTRPSPLDLFHSGKPVVLRSVEYDLVHVNVPPMSFPPPNTRRWRALDARGRRDAP